MIVVIPDIHLCNVGLKENHKRITMKSIQECIEKYNLRKNDTIILIEGHPYKIWPFEKRRKNLESILRRYLTRSCKNFVEVENNDVKIRFYENSIEVEFKDVIIKFPMPYKDDFFEFIRKCFRDYKVLGWEPDISLYIDYLIKLEELLNVDLSNILDKFYDFRRCYLKCLVSTLSKRYNLIVFAGAGHINDVCFEYDCEIYWDHIERIEDVVKTILALR